MRIGLISISGDPRSLSTWSGTPAHLAAALEEIDGVNIMSCCPLRPATYRAARVVSALTARLGRRVLWEVEPAVGRRYMRTLRRNPDMAAADRWLFLGCLPRGSSANDPPIATWIDSTFAQRLGRTPWLDRIARRSHRELAIAEREAFTESTCVLAASNSALQDVRHRYGVPEERSHLVPFGASLAPDSPVPERASKLPYRVLSVGVHWHRKGMDLAVATIDALVAGGQPVELDVVGVDPPSDDWLRPYVRYHGFISRGPQLDRLFREADLFLLPSRDEPFGIAFAEAGAYGLPVVGLRVGGVPDIVVPSTGVLLGELATPLDLAGAVGDLLGDQQARAAMAKAARARYEDRFRWSAVAQSICEILERV